MIVTRGLLYAAAEEQKDPPGGELAAHFEAVPAVDVADVAVAGKGLKDQQRHNSQRHNPEDGVIGQGRGLLARAVLLEESGAVRPHLDLKDDKAACPVELRARRGQKLSKSYHLHALSV